ncbi:DUF5624 domain-containing protein [Streptomyces sp. PSKA54]|uniref:DUF5624 domain-containing protein n=1 Tax=Streptomyces himalayensis subsp. aureolus TaxID=2758039 RepID=A0A7W2CYA4_9ACTN|nr:DUF5624 domain-containing protein [Streptomyces himalayensis]MBA4861112.1 DUF5624 domain-containing protein [Streptomyces himalayensis subsp. aureolus]
MAANESPELVDLFTTYTAGPTSIGSHLTRTAAADTADAPLIVATGTDFALYPGGGKPPTVEGFRFSTKGFKELAGVSHLGPAVATLVQLREKYADPGWRSETERLLTEVRRSREANSAELWRDTIAVETYRGREQAIADMADYTFAVTDGFLSAALEDETRLNAAALRTDYLEKGTAEGHGTVNHMMIATFFLTGLDISRRIIHWFREQQIDWSRAMVVIAGKQGRPTAGVTWNTSSVATMLLGASGYQLPLERLYMAPHAPTFTTPLDGDLSKVAALEQPLRQIWSNTRATVELGDLMFPGLPCYAPGRLAVPDISDPSVTEISEMPVIHGPDDWRAMTTRLRMVMEDPRQLLSGSVTDYAVSQLVAADNNPAKVTVPGLDNVTYPTGL